MVLFLCAVFYACEVSKAAHDAHSKAAIRLIGEALDDGDIDSARNAIHEYNTQGQSPAVIVDILADRNQD